MPVSFELFSRGLELSSAKANLGRLEQTFRMLFVVRASGSTDVVAVSQFLWAGLPWNLTAYGNPYAILDTWDAKPEDENKRDFWVGAATYKQSDSQGLSTVVDFGSNKYEEVVWKGLDEDDNEIAILNAAGDRFLDPVKEVVNRQVIKISKCYPITSFTPTQFAAFKNSVNENPIRIADIAIIPRGAWMVEAVPKIQVLSVESYAWRFDMEIEVKGEGKTYDREILNCGMYYLEELATQPSDAAISSGGLIRRDGVWYRRVLAKTRDPDSGKMETAKDPVLLDEYGGRLADTTPGNETYLTVQTKPRMDWSVLDLPATVWEVLFVG